MAPTCSWLIPHRVWNMKGIVDIIVAFCAVVLGNFFHQQTHA